MKFTVYPHRGKEFTGKWIYEYAEKYKNDIGDLKNADILDYFNLVRNIPYVNDPELFRREYTELVARPGFCLQADKLDCKKKACLIGAYCECNNFPYILVSCSEKPDKEIHHVFPAVCLDGKKKKYINFDATYPNMYIGQPKTFLTFAEILPR